MSKILFFEMQTMPISKNLDHLGLVSGMCDRLELVSEIDRHLPNANGLHQVSTGTCVKALILNGLGFTQRRLYLSPQFFEDKPIEHLLGEGLSASMFNDDRLGRCLDDLYAHGVSKLFSDLASHSYKLLGLDQESGSEFRHLDSTSFSVEGRYNSDMSESELSETSCLYIGQGYSRDHRPDLNQVMLNLVVENSSGIPLLMEGLHGNSSDQTSFRQTVAQYVERLSHPGQPICWVADSAFYTEETLSKHSGNYYWISRVPAKLAEAQEALSLVSEEYMLSFGDPSLENYRYQSICSTYGGVKQEWLVIFSQEAYQREIISLRKNYLKQSSEELKTFGQLCKKKFSCEADAKQAWQDFQKKCKYLQIENVQYEEIQGFKGRGKPGKNAQKQVIAYQITGCPATQITHYQELKKTKGKFIIASNDVEQRWGQTARFQAYKDQSKVEKGFRFLKDPSFLADNFFVKKPQRMEAILFIMTLSLMVYAALERELRKKLLQAEEFIPSQVKKTTQKPTMKWVFELFKGIHCLFLNNQQPMIILNLNEVHTKIIDLLGKQVMKYYCRE